jgi:pimeloyl-ACP methyl ester carboxylesterase
MADEPRQHHARIDGVRLHWLELGSGEGTPLVLLHGLYDSHRTWKHVAGALAQDRLVLMPDLPGHGLSDRPDASYELGWHARIVAQWLASTGRDQVDVLGHSFGGGVAQMLLLECPERIRRLVLLAPGGLGREIRTLLRLVSVPQVVERFGQPFMGIGTYLALRGERAFTKEDIEELVAMNAGSGSARAFARTVRDIIGWRGQRRMFFDRAHELRGLPPIAVLWGDRDAIIPIAHGKRFAESVDGVVFIPFEGCGHYLHREEPDGFVRLVREFLDTPGVRPATLKNRTPAGAPRARSRVS